MNIQAMHMLTFREGNGVTQFLEADNVNNVGRPVVGDQRRVERVQPESGKRGKGRKNAIRSHVAPHAATSST